MRFSQFIVPKMFSESLSIIPINYSYLITILTIVIIVLIINIINLISLIISSLISSYMIKFIDDVFNRYRASTSNYLHSIRNGYSLCIFFFLYPSILILSLIFVYLFLSFFYYFSF